MSDPRADVDFVGIGYRAETFAIDNSTITYSSTADNGSSQVGYAVGLSAAGTVELVGDGEEVIGKLIQVNSDNFATVQTKGYCTLPGGDGATLTLGSAIVGDLDADTNEGFIRSSDGSTAGEIIVQRGKIIDAGTTTAVVVDLG